MKIKIIPDILDSSVNRLIRIYASNYDEEKGMIFISDENLIALEL